MITAILWKSVYLFATETSQKRVQNHNKEQSKQGVTNTRESKQRSLLLESVLLPLVEEIRLGRAEIDDLGAPVPILLLQSALLAVVRVAHSRSTADHATTLQPHKAIATTLSLHLLRHPFFDLVLIEIRLRHSQ